MTKLNKLSVGVFALVLALGASLIAQAFTTTYAANTLLGDNEVITISGTTDGQPLNAPRSVAGYSADGNILVFSSDATNLPNAGVSGLYSYNIKTGIVARVNISTEGILADRAASDIKVSETGRYITFLSDATNLVSQSVEPFNNIFLRDMQEGVTTYVTRGTVYLDRNGPRNLGISDDGRLRLFASRYGIGDYPYRYKIIVEDRALSGSPWSILGEDGSQEGSSSSTAVRGSLSCDGSFAVYNRLYDVNIADLRNSSTPTITQLTSNGSSPLISCNGRYALYTTAERTSISPTPTGIQANKHYLVRYDRITGEKRYINSNSSGVFSAGFQINTGSEPYENAFNASIADTGDVVFKYNGNTYLKHLSDGSGTLEPIAKTVTGTYLNVQNGTITRDGKYVYFSADPYDLGMTSSSMGVQLIRTKTNL